MTENINNMSMKKSACDSLLSPNEMSTCCSTNKKPELHNFQVHWTVKFSVFLASVFSLSLFFAGWRQLNQQQNINNWLLIASGIILTVSLACLQGYWIYFDEKAKGNLRRRIGFYEKIYELISARHLAHKGLNDKENLSC